MIAGPALNITPNQSQTDALLDFLAERWVAASDNADGLTAAAFADGTVTIPATPHSDDGALPSSTTS